MSEYATLYMIAAEALKDQKAKTVAKHALYKY
jgi:hypothetical protein